MKGLFFGILAVFIFGLLTIAGISIYEIMNLPVRYTIVCNGKGDFSYINHSYKVDNLDFNSWEKAKVAAEREKKIYETPVDWEELDRFEQIQKERGKSFHPCFETEEVGKDVEKSVEQKSIEPSLSEMVKEISDNIDKERKDHQDASHKNFVIIYNLMKKLETEKVTIPNNIPPNMCLTYKDDPEGITLELSESIFFDLK